MRRPRKTGVCRSYQARAIWVRPPEPGRDPSHRQHPCLERKLYRVGPTCETWPNNLTENPYQSPKVGPQSGPTLSNLRLERARLAGVVNPQQGAAFLRPEQVPEVLEALPSRPLLLRPGEIVLLSTCVPPAHRTHTRAHARAHPLPRV